MRGLLAKSSGRQMTSESQFVSTHIVRIVMVPRHAVGVPLVIALPSQTSDQHSLAVDFSFSTILFARQKQDNCTTELVCFPFLTLGTFGTGIFNEVSRDGRKKISARLPVY